MKARVATVLSLTGVLVAGSAAALVNTQVLRGTTPASNAVVQLVDESSSPSDDVEVTTTSAATTTASVTTTATAPAATLKAFKVGESGTVVLDTAGDVLRIESAKPGDGWTVTALDQIDGLNVLVTFQKGDDIVDFRANLLFGTITPSVSVRTSSTQGTTATSTNGSGTTNTSTGNSTQTTVDDSDDDSTNTTDDSGKGKGGGGSGDDSSSDDD